MSRRIYLVLLLLLLAAFAAMGVYFRQRAAAAAPKAPQANCDTPAPPPKPATPPPALSSVEGPKLPGFAIEPGCGTGGQAPPRRGSGQAKAADKKK